MNFENIASKKFNKIDPNLKDLNLLVNTKQGYIWVDINSEKLVSRTGKFSEKDGFFMKNQTSKIMSEIKYTSEGVSKQGVNGMNFMNVSLKH